MAALKLLARVGDPGRCWKRVPGPPVAMLIDLMLVRDRHDDDGETMAVPEKHRPLPTLKGYHSPLEYGRLTIARIDGKEIETRSFDR